MSRESLSQLFVPTLQQYELSQLKVDQIEAAEQELASRAKSTEDHCWGYFGEQDDLPACRELSSAQPSITTGYMSWRQKFHFSWLRFSFDREGGEPTYHLDANGAEGLREKSENGSVNDSLLPSTQVWRLLLNLHGTAPRKLAFLNVRAEALELHEAFGNIGLAKDEYIDPLDEELMIIPPREGTIVWGAHICVSRVFHAGMETPEGHFLGSWSREVAA